MIKKIDVTRLWEGIPAWLILDLFGEARWSLHNIKSDTLFVREIQFSQTIKFILEDENGERFEINTKTASDHTKEAQRYLTNPVNLLKFSNLLLDRIVQNKKAIGDIQSQFQGGRRRKYLNEYKQKFCETLSITDKDFVYTRLLVERIINISRGDVSATPTLAMWILEGIREYYAKEIKPFDIDFETSDGQVYQLRECSIRVSDFPPLFVHDLFGYPSIERYPRYKNVTSNVYIKDTLIREHIYHRKPVHSSFMSCWNEDCIPKMFEAVAEQIVKFINHHLLNNFNELMQMSLHDAYLTSWAVETAPSILNYRDVLVRYIVEGMRKEVDYIVEHGIENSMFLKNTTVKKTLEDHVNILEDRGFVMS